MEEGQRSWRKDRHLRSDIGNRGRTEALEEGKRHFRKNRVMEEGQRHWKTDKALEDGQRYWRVNRGIGGWTEALGHKKRL